MCDKGRDVCRVVVLCVFVEMMLLWRIIIILLVFCSDNCLNLMLGVKW